MGQAAGTPAHASDSLEGALEGAVVGLADGLVGALGGLFGGGGSNNTLRIKGITAYHVRVTAELSGWKHSLLPSGHKLNMRSAVAVPVPVPGGDAEAADDAGADDEPGAAAPAELSAEQAEVLQFCRGIIRSVRERFTLPDDALFQACALWLEVCDGTEQWLSGADSSADFAVQLGVQLRQMAAHHSDIWEKHGDALEGRRGAMQQVLVTGDVQGVSSMFDVICVLDAICRRLRGEVEEALHAAASAAPPPVAARPPGTAWGVATVADEAVFTWAPQTVHTLREVPFMQDGANNTSCVAALGAGSVVTGGGDGAVRQWHVAAGGKWLCVRELHAHKHEVVCIVSLTPSRFVSGDSRGTLFMWELGAGGAEGDFKCLGTAQMESNRRCGSLARLSDSSAIVGFNDGLMAVLSAPDGAAPATSAEGGDEQALPKCTLAVGEACAGQDTIRAIALNSQGVVAVGGDDKKLHLYKSGGEQPGLTHVAALEGHESSIYALAWYGDDDVVTGDSSGKFHHFKRDGADAEFVHAGRIAELRNGARGIHADAEHGLLFAVDEYGRSASFARHDAGFELAESRSDNTGRVKAFCSTAAGAVLVSEKGLLAMVAQKSKVLRKQAAFELVTKYRSDDTLAGDAYGRILHLSRDSHSVAVYSWKPSTESWTLDCTIPSPAGVQVNVVVVLNEEQLVLLDRHSGVHSLQREDDGSFQVCGEVPEAEKGKPGFADAVALGERAFAAVSNPYKRAIRVFERQEDGSWAVAHELEAHEEQVASLVASNDGKTLYSLDRNDCILQWRKDALTGAWAQSTVAERVPGTCLHSARLALHEEGFNSTLVRATSGKAPHMLRGHEGAWKGYIMTGVDGSLGVALHVPGLGWCGHTGYKDLHIWTAEGSRAPLSVQAEKSNPHGSDAMSAGVTVEGEFVSTSGDFGVRTLLKQGPSGLEFVLPAGGDCRPKYVVAVPDTDNTMLVAHGGGLMRVLRKHANGKWEELARTDMSALKGHVTAAAKLKSDILIGTSEGMVAVLHADASGVQLLWKHKVSDIGRTVLCLAVGLLDTFAVAVQLDGHLSVYTGHGSEWSRKGKYDSSFSKIEALTAFGDAFVTSDGDGDHPLQLWTSEGWEYTHCDLGTAPHRRVAGIFGRHNVIFVTGDGDHIAVFRENEEDETWVLEEGGPSHSPALKTVMFCTDTSMVASTPYNSFHQFSRPNASSQVWTCDSETDAGPGILAASCQYSQSDLMAVVSVNRDGTLCDFTSALGKQWDVRSACGGHATYERAQHWCAVGANRFATGGDKGGLVIWGRDSAPGAPWEMLLGGPGDRKGQRAVRGLCALGEDSPTFAMLMANGMILRFAEDGGDWDAAPLFTAAGSTRLVVLSPTRLLLCGADGGLAVWENRGGWAAVARLPAPAQELRHLLRLTEDRFVSVDGDQLRTWGRGDDGAWSELAATTLPYVKATFLHTGLEGGLVTDGGSGQVLLLAPEGDGWAITKGPKQFHTLEAAYVLSAERIITESGFNHPEVWTLVDGEWKGDKCDSAPGFWRCGGVMPDGTICTISSECLLSVWAPDESGKYARQKSGAQEGQVACHASLSSKWAVTGAEDGSVAVWTPDSFGALRESAPLKWHTATVAHVCAVSETCFASLDTAGKLCVWHKADGQWAPATVPEATEPVRGVAVEAANGTLYVLGASGKVALWRPTGAGEWMQVVDASTGVESSGPASLAIADGRVCVGTSDGKVHFWGGAAGDGEVFSLGDVHAQAVSTVAVMPDGRFVTSSTDRTVCVWRRDEAGAWQPSPALPAAPHAATTVTVLPGGIVASVHEEDILLWHEVSPNNWLARPGNMQLGPADSSLECESGSAVLCVAKKRLLLWEPGSSVHSSFCRVDCSEAKAANCIAAWAGGVALTASDRGRSSTWRRGEDGAWGASPGLPEPFLGEPRCLTAVQDAGDGVHRVVLGTKAGLAAVWRLSGDGGADGKWQLQALLPGHSAAVSTALSLPEGLLLTADIKGFAQLWAPDGTGGYAVADTLREAAGDFVCGAVGESGWAFLGMRSGTVRVLKVVSGDDASLQVASSLVLHNAQVERLCVTGVGGRCLLSVDQGRTVGVSVYKNGVWTPVGSSRVLCNSINGVAPHALRPAVVAGNGTIVTLSG